MKSRRCKSSSCNSRRSCWLEVPERRTTHGTLSRKNHDPQNLMI